MRISSSALFLCILVCVTAKRVFDDDFPDEEFDYVGKEGDLVQVLMLTRHGLRTPKHSYFSDPWGSAKYWPEGWQQLTAVGAKQHASLAIWLRNRYPDFIPTEYKTAEILIRSTAISRTLASAFALATSLFPEQAIPIHSAEKIFSPHKSCPAFKKELKRFLTSSAVRSDEASRARFYRTLTKRLGRKVHALGTTEMLYSLLSIEKQRGYKLPHWTKHVYPQPLKNMSSRYLCRTSATPLLKRLRYGTLLKDILHHAKRAGTPGNTKKVLIYSAHDFTLIGILNCLNLYDGEPSGFASSITFEVRRGKQNHSNSIQMFYRSDSIVEPVTLEVPQCGRPCSVKKLVKILAPVIPKNIRAECKNRATRRLYAFRTAEDVSLLWAVALGSSALGAILVICCSKLYICGRPPLWRMYQPHVMNCEVATIRRNDYVKLNGENYLERL